MLAKNNKEWYINIMNTIPKMLKQLIEEKEKTSIRRVAESIGVDHGSLYRALSDSGNPERKTIEKILDYLGYDIFLKPKRKGKRPKKSKPSRARLRSRRSTTSGYEKKE